MPLVNRPSTGSGFLSYQPPEAPDDPDKSVLESAFRLENDVVNFFAHDEQFIADPNYDVAQELNKPENERFLANYKSVFAGARSTDEFAYLKQKVLKEERDRAVLAQAGVPGILAAIGAGLLSPTSLLPLTTGAKGLKAAASGIALGVVGVGAQESVLYAQQETRTPTESFINIGTGAVIGGVLGGISGAMRHAEFDRLSRDVHMTSGNTWPSTPVAIGADAVESRLQAFQGDFTFTSGGKPFRADVENMLVVTPQSAKHLPFFRTQEQLFRWAKKQGYDGVAVDGFFAHTPQATQLRRRDVILADLERAADEDELLALRAEYAEVAGEYRRKGLAALRKEYEKTPDTPGGQKKKAVLERELARRDEVPIPWQKGVTKVFDEKKLTEVDEGALPKKPHSFGPGVVEVPSASAAFARGEGAGRLKGGANFLAFHSPVTRQINGTFESSRWAMAQLSTAGLKLEGNVRGIASAEGGTIQSRIGTYYGDLAKVLDAQANLYADYLLGAGSGGIARTTRAALQGTLTSAGKMSYKEFREEIGRVLDTGESSGIAEVDKAAQIARTELYDKVKAQAEAVELIDPDIDLPGSKEYLNRVYRNDLIERNETEFIDLVAAHIEKKMDTEFAEQYSRFTRQQRQAEEKISDMRLDPAGVAQLREQIAEELRILEGDNEGFVKQLDDINAARRAARQGKADKDVARKLTDQVTERGGEQLKEFKRNRADLRRRLRNLERNKFVVEQKQQKKLQKAERIEELQIRTLRRLHSAFATFQARMDDIAPRKLAREWAEFSIEVEELQKQLDLLEEEMDGILSAKEMGGTDGLLRFAEMEKQVDEELRAATSNMEMIEDFDREFAIEKIEEALEVSLRKANDINSRRALRQQKLDEAAAKLDPRLVEEEAKQLELKYAERKAEFGDKIRQRGADDLDLTTGTASFKQAARDSATEIMHSILGTYRRLPNIDIVLGPRGPALARVLDIPRDFSHNGVKFEDFLESDSERLMATYLRTMAPDIEIKRKFGTPGGELELQKLREEKSALDRQVTEDVSLDEATKRKRKDQLDKDYRIAQRDLEAVIGRLRHTWGVPKNPRGFAARAAKIAMNLNVLRFMGGVTIASIPDISRAIQKYGLVNTYRHGFAPFVARTKQMQLTKREARLAAVGVDSVLHTRARELFDVLDETREGSKFERGLEYVTSRMGQIALFDYWTDAMKQISAGVINAKMMDSIELVMNGGGTKKEIDQATEFLAASGINAQGAGKIWAQLQAGGGEKVNGVWLPNTEDWMTKNADGDLVPDHETVTLYRQALLQNANDTIITPGVERPLIADSNLALRMMMQFRSFAMSSTSKTLMAGLQERDAAFVTGTMVSLALGAMSYALWATAVGGDAYEEMLEADLDKWADEAISRSGLPGIFSEVQRVGERIPAISQTPLRYGIGKLSAERNTRRAGSDIYDAIFGPSFDLGLKGTGVLVGMDDPTQSTLHSLRLMTPFQNHFLLRRIFDQVESATGDFFDLPEKRQ